MSMTCPFPTVDARPTFWDRGETLQSTNIYPPSHIQLPSAPPTPSETEKQRMDTANFPFLAVRSHGNDVLLHNRPIANNNLTSHGSSWCWAVCSLHASLLLGVIVWTYVTEPRRRAFHYFSVSVLLIATIYYFVLASDLGGHAVPVEFRVDGLPGRTRQVFWVRWIGYFLNFSLIYFALTLLSGVGWASILFTVGLSMLWAVMFLVGGLVPSTYKWGFFVFAVLIYFFIMWQVLGVARSYARRVEPDVHKICLGLAAYVLGLMALYPISWGLSEGGNKIQVDSEMVFYGVLDIFTQGVFALLLVGATRKLDFDRMGLGFSEYGRIRDHAHWRDDVHQEKVSRGEASIGGTAGPVPDVAPV